MSLDSPQIAGAGLSDCLSVWAPGSEGTCRAAAGPLPVTATPIWVLHKMLISSVVQLRALQDWLFKEDNTKLIHRHEAGGGVGLFP